MSRRKPNPSAAPARAPQVGTAEFRGNLAKYLKQARSGMPVIIQERGRNAYMLSRFENEEAPSILGCMSERTVYVAGSVVNAAESWSAGSMP